MSDYATLPDRPERLQLPSDADHSGRRLGAEELALLTEVIASGTLNCQRGVMVRRLEEEFAHRYGGNDFHCTAVTSGTAAIHAALAALNPEPGDEIITTPVTDMGAITPILYQGAVPVFADLDPHSFNVTADSIRSVLSPRTRAIIATHLFGAPCDMAPILELAAQHALPVIEDAAQAPFATYDGRRVGTLGTIGCFSLQQSKHMTCGEGGLVITRDADLARRITLFHNKAWGYADAQPDHYFLALNYRMTELQGAVALAQFDKGEAVVRCRQRAARMFTAQIAGLPGIAPQQAPTGSESAYWKYVLRVDESQTGADVGQIAAFLRERYGIPSSPRYVQKPAYMCQVLRERLTFGHSHFPYEGPQRGDSPPVRYRADECPGALDALAHMLVLPWNENYTEQHVDFIAHAVREAVAHFSRDAAA